MMFSLGAKGIFPNVHGMPNLYGPEDLRVLDDASVDAWAYSFISSHLFGGARKTNRQRRGAKIRKAVGIVHADLIGRRDQPLRTGNRAKFRENVWSERHVLNSFNYRLEYVRSISGRSSGARLRNTCTASALVKDFDAALGPSAYTTMVPKK